MENESRVKESTTINNKLYDELRSLFATVITQNIAYWCYRNEKNNRQDMYADGKYWTALSYEYIIESMPFKKGVSAKQLQRAFRTLIEEKHFIEKKRKFNGNNWYAPTKELREFLGDQYDSLTKFNNENYNPNYDKNKTNEFSDNKQQPQENDFSEYEYGEKRQKLASDPVVNDDFTFRDDFSSMKAVLYQSNE